MIINFFNAPYWNGEYFVFDWYAKTQPEMSFDSFKEYISEFDDIVQDKTDSPMWTFIRPSLEGANDKRGRKRNNPGLGLGASALVLDYDGSLSIEEFEKTYSSLSYVLYTTFSHKSEKKEYKDCFRVILELTSDIPWNLLHKPSVESESILDSLREIFPESDQCCFEPERAFYLPASSSKVTIKINNGLALDWESLERTPKLEPREYIKPVVQIGGTGSILLHTLDLHRYFHDAGLVRQNSGNLIEVQCPNHFEHTSGDSAKLIKFDGKWEFKCQHSHCGASNWVRNYIFNSIGDAVRPYCETVVDGLVFVGAEKEEQEQREQEQGKRQKVKLQKREFSKIKSRENREKCIKSFCARIQNKFAKHFVLKTAEGFGKSTMLVNELIKTRSIIFCCASNAQADEKMIDFAFHEPVRVWSLCALLKKKYSINPVMSEAGEFDAPILNIDLTLIEIRKELKVSKEEALEIIEALQSEVQESRNSSADLLITTFTTGELLARTRDSIIIVDDPSLSDLSLAKYENLEIVALRDLDKILMKGARGKVIWTTTENLVVRTIEFQNPGCIISEINENIETNENILLVPTIMCRRKLKPVIAGMAKCISKKLKEEQLLIMNRNPGGLNLVSTKGQNNLKQDTVIAISFSHPDEIAAVTYSLGLDDVERNRIRQQMAIDVMDQAIGRAQGYRETTTRTLVLCEPQLEIPLRMRSRYRLNSPEGIKKRGKIRGHAIEFNVYFPEWWSLWIGYIEVWHKYVWVNEESVLDMSSIADLDVEFRKLIKNRLNEPVGFTELVWKSIEEIAEGESRKNFSLEIRKLLDEQNEQTKKSGLDAKSAGGKSSGKKMAGKKWFTDGISSIRCAPGAEPADFFEGRS